MKNEDIEVAHPELAKVIIGKDLLRVVVKLKKAGITDKEIAEHLTQLIFQDQELKAEVQEHLMQFIRG